MLTIAADRNLPAGDRAALLSSAVVRLARLAHERIDEAFAADTDDERHAGEFAGISDETLRVEGVDAVLRPIGGGRLRVHPALFRALDDDAGLVVIASDDPADLQPAPVEGDEGKIPEGQGDAGDGTPEGTDVEAQREALDPQAPPAVGDPVEVGPVEPANPPEDEPAADEAPAFDPTTFATVDDLRAFAREHDLNLHGASTRADVEAAIAAGLAERALQSTPEEGAGDGTPEDTANPGDAG